MSPPVVHDLVCFVCGAVHRHMIAKHKAARTACQRIADILSDKSLAAQRQKQENRITTSKNT
jgi:hypothetical protein